MWKSNKSIEELLKELTKLRRENSELKKSEKKLKQAQKTMLESEEMYRTLVKTSPEAIGIYDLNNNIIEVSDQWLEMWGYVSRDEVIGRNCLEFIASEDHSIVEINKQKIFNEGYVRNMEITFIKKNGTRFIGESNAALIKDDKGKPKWNTSITRDITDWKLMEEKLRQKVKDLHKKIQQNLYYPEIIGNSTKILKVIDLAHQVAHTNSTVLIYGETGIGKDLVAKAIHFNSAHKKGPFLTINCAALPEHLIESELFGYAKGAFTGAYHDKKGLFEEANGGTIFLNEIADLPLKLQAKLLQVIESQLVRRLGQSKSIKVYARIVAASNRDLEEAVNNQNFRKDLFYRLNVFPILIPPLRERKEDIPLLVKHFLDKYCLSMDKKITDVSQKAMDLLCDYNYPGNVRELENIIQRAIIMAQGSILLPQYLPDKLRGVAASGVKAYLAELEKNMIINVIHQCKSDLDQAAKQLGYSRTTLWRRMKKLDINF